MARNYCELELRLQSPDPDRYLLSAQFSDPKRDIDNQLLDPVEVPIDLGALSAIWPDTTQYGAALTAMLFGGLGSPMRAAFGRAQAAAAGSDGLRIRLSIQGAAMELHALRWETLLNPETSTPLLKQERILFSRFLSAADLRLRPIPEADDLKALIVVANPDDLAQWGLAAIDKDKEIDAALTALTQGGRGIARRITPKVLKERATIGNITSSLRKDYADVLILICHGRCNRDDEPRLILESETGAAKLVEGSELVERLRDMDQQPRLIVLASCESAGAGQGNVLAAIGPRLAAAGVPGVIAMQDQVTLASARSFMTTLFEELTKDGQIDRAVALARSQIRDRDDWWVPVLFMRLKTGQVWPRMVGDSRRLDKWDGLASDIANGQCVPVLGPALAESTLGSMRNVARALAERYVFALSPRDQDELAYVAQYLRYRQNKNLVIDEIRTHFVAHIRERFRDDLQDVGRAEGKDYLNCRIEDGTVDELVSALGRLQRARDKHNVHRLLAKLPVKVFVSANRDNLLYDALVDEGKRPQVRLCTWLTRNQQPISVGPELPPGYIPTTESPLIFHAFGSLKYRQSLVLTEDDYFDFLIAVTRNANSPAYGVPAAVTTALSCNGLLLLGFQPHDWDFRVLFRGILKQPGDPLSADTSRVAVQMGPMDGQMIDPDRASEYFQAFFNLQGGIDTFWGSVDEFMLKLAQKCATRGLLSID